MNDNLNDNIRGGWVRLYRSFIRSSIWTMPWAWKITAIACMLLANHKPTKWWDGTAEVLIPAGSFITSLRNMEKTVKITQKQTRAAFRALERAGFLTTKRTHKWTMVSICNWARYQPMDDYEGTEIETVQGTPEGAVRAQWGHSEGTVRATNKNDKNEENEKNIPPIPPFAPPDEELSESWNLKPPTENGKPDVEKLIGSYARRIFDRHKKKRGCSLAMATAKLRTACSGMSVARVEKLLAQIDQSHEAWCLSYEWTKDGGEYQKGLDPFLNPKARRWEALPDPKDATEDPGDLPEYRDPYGDEE